METKALEYFSSLNPLVKKTIADVVVVQQIFGEEWESMDWKRQEEVLDDYFVDPNTRKKYENHRKKNEYPKSFPRLTIQSGEKIVVEMENDFWTWQDEHSAPFSWKSKSQQDLTLLDLEPEEMSKPLSAKNRKGSQGSLGDETKNLNNIAPSEFVYKPGESLWYSTFPAALKKLDEMPASIQKNMTNKNGTQTETKLNGSDKSPQEINYAFKDSSHDIRGITNGEISQLDKGIKMIDEKVKVTKVIVEEEPVAPKRKSKQVAKPQVKPPSPPTTAKVKLSSSFSKKDYERSEILLKQQTKRDNKEGSGTFDTTDNAFDNPVLIKDWTRSVEGDSEEFSSTNSSPSHKPLLREPITQTIEREDNERKVAGTLHYDSGSSGKEDVQSLLNNTEKPDDDLNTAYIEHNMVSMAASTNNDPNATEDFDVKKTGFDFLDNW